jgi:pilus assembly protein CpaB
MARTLTAAGPDRANRMIFFGAVGLAALAAIAVFAALANFGGDEGSAANVEALEVIVASQNIDAGDRISEDMVELASMPANVLIDSAFTEESVVVGTRALHSIERGDQLSPSKVSGGEFECGNTSCVIPFGMRGFAIQITEETGGGGNIVPGDRVDVVVVAETAVEGTSVVQGTLLLQNIEVVAVAQKTLTPVSPVDENGDLIEGEGSAGVISAADADADEDPDAATVLVAVFPEDVPLLAVAQEEGTIYLSLRGFGDDGVVEGGAERVLP